MSDETCRCEILDPTTEGGGTDPRSCPLHAYEAGRRHERRVYLEERAEIVAQRDEAIHIARDLITWAKASDVSAGAVIDAGARLARLSPGQSQKQEK
jgi:hypothetical protein